MGAIQKQTGFTIVELLIVVVVIAILAAITIVSYNGINSRAMQSAAESMAQQVGKKVLFYATLNNDNYPPDLNAIDISASDQQKLQYSIDNNASPRKFGLTATSGKFSYYISSTNSMPTAGAYPGHAANGVAAVTNLSTNPSIENDTSTYGASNVSATMSTNWAAQGTRSLRQAPGSTSSSDSFSAIGGDSGGIRMGLEAGKTYTLSATIRVPSAMTGTLDTRARTIVVYTKDGSAGYVATSSQQAANTTGTTRLNVTFTVPTNVTEAFARLYNGARQGGGDTYWDAVMLTEGSTVYAYADGDSSGWAWKGTAGNSASSGPVLQP